MEHRLILGGENFLPFARSRVKALRANGLAYASQQFEIDGVRVSVRIEPGHDHIRIEGGSHSLKMDSGIAEAGFTHEGDPRRYLPGTMTKPASVLAYDAAFTEESKKAPWWINPGKTSDGQLSGEIAGGQRFTGMIRTDNVAKSFTPNNLTQGDPPKKVPNPADETLVGKKMASDLCPPSMFTGRARLYAQALFGQYLYDDKEQSNSPPALVMGNPPALKLSTYLDKDKERVEAFKAINPQSAYDITLNINSGVYLDPISGKHWLMNPVVGRMTVYPLVSSTAGEALRKWLKPAMAGKLSAEDRNHLEAYILSACRPHVELRTVLAISSGINPYSMGYGWHWNWSGTRADMVQNLATNIPASGSMSATHYRLSIEAHYDPESRGTSWAAGTTTIEGPTRWSEPRAACCITEPTWANRNTNPSALPSDPPIYWSMKTSSAISPQFECDAPFYAFYAGDQLRVCRIKAKYVDTQPRTVKATTGFVTFLHPGNPDNLDYIFENATLGASAGFVEESGGAQSHWIMTLSCGPENVELVFGFHELLWSRKSSTKTDLGPLGGFTNNIFGPGGYTYLYGDPREDGTWASVTHAPGWWGAERYHLFSFDQIDEHEERTYTGVIGAIIPFYDAEACYLIQDSQRESFKNLQTAQVMTGIYAEERSGIAAHYDPPGSQNIVIDGPVGPYIKNVWNRPTGSLGPEEDIPDEVVVTDHKVSLKAIFKGQTLSSGVVPSGAMSLFAEPMNEYVGATFKTLSSASQTEPIVSGLIDRGWPAGDMRRPVIVGWA